MIGTLTRVSLLCKSSWALVILFFVLTPAPGGALKLFPTFGPTGTYVKAETAGGRLIAKVTIEGKVVRSVGDGTRNAFFTIPYDLSPGDHYVVVSLESELNPVQENFKVTTITPPPAILLTGYELGNLPYAQKPRVRMVLYGSGFDTDCVAVIGTHEIDESYPPDVDLNGTTTTLLSPARDRLLVALLDPKRDLPMGAGPYTVSVLNRSTGEKSPTPLSIMIPERRILVQVDRMSARRGNWSPDWEPEVVERFKPPELTSLRKIYTNAGFFLDIHDEKTQSWSEPTFTHREVVAFDRCLATLRGTANEQREWYVHVSLLTREDSDDDAVKLGETLDESNRQGVAIFTSAMVRSLGKADQADPQYLVRTFAHELGHALNATHCEDDVDHRTLMTKSQFVADDWSFAFSPAALDHLWHHPMIEIMPGPPNLHFNSPCRVEKRCDR